MNTFGGNWTEIKIEILVKYAHAYLEIMKSREYYKLLYFDGFAGSGFIANDKKTDVELTVGAARRIVEIDIPRSFDIYYFVEKDPINFELLKKNTQDAFLTKEIHAVCEDCNKKMRDLSEYLKKQTNKNVRTLAYIDPCGMQVEWQSMECLKDLHVDMWVLVPTGMGVNRLLKNNGHISDAWMEKLERFLGMKKEDIEAHFYKKVITLFPDITGKIKETDAINKSAELFKERLKDLFKYVCEPYELKNSSNSTMYHLFLCSNNATAVKIGNDIIKKY